MAKSKKKKKKASRGVDARRLAVNEFVELETGMQVGEVYLKSIKHRKARFRKMDELQLETLRDSVSRLGPRDPIIVVPGKKEGTWELVDGHHRVDELTSQGYETTPVVVLTNKDGEPVDKATADLAMQSFNVSAHIDEKNFFDVLEEMRADGISVDEIAKVTARDKDALEELLGDGDTDSPALTLGAGLNLGSLNLPSGGAAGEPDVSGASAFGEALTLGGGAAVKESSRGKPISLVLPGTEEMEELLDDLMEEFDADTRSDAVQKLIESHSRAAPS